MLRSRNETEQSGKVFGGFAMLEQTCHAEGLLGLTDCSSVELHCFTDASKLGFETFCYFHTFDGSTTPEHL